MELIGLLLLTTLLLCLISIYRWATGSLDYWQKRGIPYVPALPAVGNFWSVLSGRICQAHLYRDLYHRFPASVRYFGILIGTCPTLIIKDPALVVKVLIKDFSHFYDRGFHVGPNDYLGNNLFFMQNPQWKAARTKMVTVFSTAKMKATFEIVDKCSNDFIDYLHTTIPDSKDVPTKVFMGDIFTDLVCKTICGINIHSITSPNKEHVYFMNVCFAPGLFQFIRSLLSFFFPKLAVHFTLFPQEVADYFTKLTTTSIEMRKQEKAQAEKRVDYLQLMIELYEKDLMLPESERVIRMQEVVSGVFVLILAGHETSSSTSTNVLHELAYNQEVQDKARREVQKVYKEGGGKVTYEDLAKMTYLEQVISEALRLYPLVNCLFRECTQDYAIPDSPHVIPKGVLVHIPTYALQTDAALWSDPLEFNPDRFAPENESKIVPGSYAPFGDGPRICIGKRFGFLQMKLVLSKVLLNYRVTPCSKSERRYPIKTQTLLAAPEGDHWLKFTKVKPEY